MILFLIWMFTSCVLQPKLQEGNNTIVESSMKPIEEVYEILTRDALSINKAKTALAQSSTQQVQSAEITAIPNTDQVSYITLQLPKVTTLNTLEAKFGSYKQPPMLHFDQPQQYIFYPELFPKRSFGCALIIETDSDQVRSIIIRRDAR